MEKKDNFHWNKAIPELFKRMRESDHRRKFLQKVDLPLFYIDAPAHWITNRHDATKVHIIQKDTGNINHEFFLPVQWVAQRTDIFEEI